MKSSVLKKLSIVLLFFVLGFFIYANTIESPFIFDDEGRIKNNPDIRIVELTLGNVSKAAFGKESSRNRPIGNISFALNYYFHKYNLKGYHIVNTIIHVLTGFLLYLFLKTTLSISTARPGYEPSNLIPLFISLLWLAHPVHTQSVTYIVQRLNSMAAMFYVLSFLLFVYGRLAKTKQKSIFLFIGSALSWILALGCKQNAAPLPFYIFLYEWFFFQDLSWAWFKRQIKFLLGITILFILICLIFLQHLGQNPWETFTAKFTPEGYTFTEKFITQFRVVIYYISLFFYPHPARLNLDRDFPLSHSLVDPVTTLLSLCVILTLVGSAIYLSRRERLLSFCIFWFFGNLIIESLIPKANIFDHRTYLPYMLLSVIPVVLAYRYVKPEKLCIPLLCALVIIGAYWTYERNRDWKDDLTIWTDTVKKSPGKARPHLNLGKALANRNLLDEAIRHYTFALKIKPNYAKTHYNLGNALAKKGKANEAIERYHKALQLAPRLPEVHNNLGSALAKQGQIDQAIALFSDALRINPDYAEAHFNLAGVLFKKGMTSQAIKHYAEATRLDPGSGEAYYNLGIALEEKGQTGTAIKNFFEALRINPDYTEVHYNLGRAFQKQGRQSEAIKHYESALFIQPKFIPALNNLAVLYAVEKKYEKAIFLFKKTVSLQPDNPGTYYNIARVYAVLNRVDDCIEWLKLSVEKGYTDWEGIKTDKSFDNIRESTQYKKLIEKN